MKRLAFILLTIVLSTISHARFAPLNVKHLTVVDGLNDGVVNAVCQDKYGFMWVASQGALNRYDGLSVKRFSHIQGDSTSAPNSSPVAMAYDGNDRLWIGYSTGLVEYDFATESFKYIQQFKNQFVYLVLSISKEQLIVGTMDDTYLYNIRTKTVEPFTATNDTVSKNNIDNNYVHDYCLLNGKLYMASDGAILIYDTHTHQLRYQKLASVNSAVNRIFADEQGQLWISAFDSRELYKLNPIDFRMQNMSHLLTVEGEQIAITDFVSDKNHNLWMLGSKNAIVKLDRNGLPTYYQYTNQAPANLLASMFKFMYCSNDGYIWFVCLTGLGYFHPDQNIFDVHYPYKDPAAPAFARVLLEDSKGNIWCATPTGVSVRNEKLNEYKIFNADKDSNNKIYSSQVNSITEDKKGNIWIATPRGINRYNSQTKKMDFFSAKDSLPAEPYYYTCTDHENVVWFGAVGNQGLYYYSYDDNKFRSIASHPVLKKYAGYGVRCIYEDSRSRLWIGFDGKGLAMYDRKNQTSTYWFNNDFKNEKTISGNVIIDIREDKVGVVWISTRSGITGIGSVDNEVTIINNQNGLHSNNCGPLAVDDSNRLWVGTTSDLVVISANRKNIAYFNQRDGLVTSSFFEHQASITPDGTFYFPTVNGYVKFHPSNYKEKTKMLDYYLSSYVINNTEHSFIISADKSPTVLLQPEENHFSFNFVTPHYNQSQQVLYAFKLKNFDKEWNYTTVPKATYTNIPPGNYKFIYKACINQNWPATFKYVDVEIKNYFYRSLWFRALLSILIVAMLYWFYRFRTNKIREVAELNDRAQLLEREKSVVQYENLKQQLNPHFLFNSLTSLSSLIATEPKIARQFVDQMSKIYRYILKSNENEIVPLINEINFAATYVKLQQTRFSEGFEVNINVDEEFNHRKIVPVTIQNLIENAIKHNIIDAESPLVIDIYVEEEYLVVKNNLQIKNIVEASNKHGLNQMKTLYRFLIDKPIVITENEKYFEIKIPLI